jgi:drug/metabolite transporter (DMT)-like permease
VTAADLVLLTANAVFGTSYVAVRLAVDDLGPITLAFGRLAIGWLILASVGLVRRDARESRESRVSRTDRWALFWMGFVGFTLATATSHSGLAWSTATNGALLIAVEPITMVALSPLVLGERLTRREAWGTLLALLGATVVVLNGIPGVTVALVPHWRAGTSSCCSPACATPRTR